ncbi:MAG: DUF4282 domain-containing protein [Henriciella sp.]|nr:DUF4282 domain-containing protein [Henriciella sp.]
MGFLSRFLSFEKPIGDLLTRLLYYLGCIGIILGAIRYIIYQLGRFGSQWWDEALWEIIKTPFGAIIAIMVLRVIAEFVLAQFRMDKSLHDQVTGRAVPPPAPKE